MRPGRDRPRQAQAEMANLIEAVKTGKDKKGLSFRPIELTDKTRKRGGRKSRRRTARVWKPREISVSDGD